MYSKLNQQCSARWMSVGLSNTKFIPPAVLPSIMFANVIPEKILEKEAASHSGGGTCSSMSPDGVCSEWKRDPTLWGPHLWAYLHFSASNYPDKPSGEQIEEMKQWLCSLPVTIPCSSCSQHYKAYIDARRGDLDVVCGSRNTLFKFLVDIHNKVNERNGKTEMSYADAWKLYE